MRRVVLEIDITDNMSASDLENDACSQIDYIIGSRIISDTIVPDVEEDDDPQCVCGVYRSEHAMMGCKEGFQTPAQWESGMKRMIGTKMRYKAIQLGNGKWVCWDTLVDRMAGPRESHIQASERARRYSVLFAHRGFV